MPPTISTPTLALFGDGLGLDSIDALELGLAVKNQYGVVLSAESEEMRLTLFIAAGIIASMPNAPENVYYD